MHGLIFGYIYSAYYGIIVISWSSKFFGYTHIGNLIDSWKDQYAQEGS